MNRASSHAGIVGCGVIGSSVGLALAAAGWQVTGLDAIAQRSDRALEIGAIDSVSPSIESLVSSAPDVVIVSVPPRVAVPTVTALLQGGARVVTDTTSIKVPIVTATYDCPAFLGGHPMAGSHRSGPDAARADLFLGANWILTPGPYTRPDVVPAVTAVIHAVGATPIVTDARSHDRAVAHTSHLPHLAAAALARAVSAAGDVGRMAGPGFRDTTRVADGPASLWVEILEGNAGEVLPALDRLRAEIDEVRDALGKGETELLRAWLARATAARKSVIHAAETSGNDTPSVVPANWPEVRPAARRN